MSDVVLYEKTRKIIQKMKGLVGIKETHGLLEVAQVDEAHDATICTPNGLVKEASDDEDSSDKDDLSD